MTKRKLEEELEVILDNALNRVPSEMLKMFEARQKAKLKQEENKDE